MKISKSQALTLLLLTVNLLSSAQEDIAELLSRLDTAKGESKIELLVDLSSEYRSVNGDSAIFYAKKAIVLADKKKSNKYSSMGNKRLAQIYAKIGEYVKARKYYNRAISYSKKDKDDNEIANIRRRIGITHSKESDYAEAIKYYRLVLDYASEAQDSSLLASIYNNLGVVYSNRGDYQKAIEYYFESVELRKAMQQEDRAAAYLNNIGIIYKKIGEYEKALSFYQQAYDIYKKKEKETGMTGTLMNIGIIYKHLDQTEKAIQNYFEALKLANKTGDVEDLGKIYHNLGNAFTSLKEHSRAIEYYKKSLTYKRKSNNQKGIALSLRDLAGTYRETHNYSLALAQVEEALAIDLAIEKQDGIMQDYKELSLIHQKMGNYKKSLDYHLLYSIQKDTVFNQEKANQILRLEAEYQSQQQENELLLKENELLSTEKELSIQSERNSTLYNILFGVIFLFLIIVSIVVYSRFLIQRKSNKALSEANKKLEQQNTELEQFAFIASHDLKEPTRLIGNFISLINRRYKDELSDEVKEYFGYIQNSSKRMYNLVTGLYEYLSLQKNASHLETVDTNEVVNRIVEEIQYGENDVDFEIFYQGLPKVQANRFQINQILKNLILNGLKYQKEGVKAIIRVSSEEANDEIILKVKDNGIGIKEEYQDRIFEIFKRLHNNEKYEGTGIGLSICKRIVDSLEGRIWVESDGHSGSTFFVALPRLR